MDQVLLDETGHHVTSLPRGILVHGDGWLLCLVGAARDNYKKTIHACMVGIAL
jgi:hypothetical protein